MTAESVAFEKCRVKKIFFLFYSKNGDVCQKEQRLFFFSVWLDNRTVYGKNKVALELWLLISVS